MNVLHSDTDHALQALREMARRPDDRVTCQTRSAVKTRLRKIPSVVRSLQLAPAIELSSEIRSVEGAVVAAEALDETGRRHAFEYDSGRIGILVRGDIFPGVLGKRRAAREFSGDIPERLQPGDILHLLGSSGVLGIIRGGDPNWGQALPVRILGGVERNGKPLNLNHAAVPGRDQLGSCAPLVAVAATCMETGKTTTACRIITHFRQQNLRVAYTKLTGFSYLAELLKARDCGADPVMDFVDGGLPSTCGMLNPVRQAALGVLETINRSSPDLIVVEFGAGILSAYNVLELLRTPEILRHARCVIVGASDTTAAWGANTMLEKAGIPIAMFTGPVANNPTERSFLLRTLGVPAESNLADTMPETMSIIRERCLPGVPAATHTQTNCVSR